MIPAIIRAALEQRLVLVVLSIVLFVFGLDAARKLSVDAFPDVTNIQVQIATEAIGRSPDEMERLVTVPIELAMTGLPAMTEMRSLNRPGLSLITLVFTDQTSVYFARQLVMERLSDVRGRMPEGVAPVLGPVSTGLGEVFQYTLQRADDGDRELTKEELTRRRTIQDWVVRPLLRSIPGVAEINSQGGFVKQYHIRVNPDRLRHYGLSLNQVFDSVSANNANAGGGVLNQHAEQFLIRSIGLVRSIDDFRNIVVKNEGATPVYLRDVAQIEEGAEVRVGGLIKDGKTESVGAVVMMLAGALIRQFFVQRHGYHLGRAANPWPFAAVGVVMMVGVIVAMRPAPAKVFAAAAQPVAFGPVQSLVAQHCLSCHGAQVQMKNVRLDSPEWLQKHAQNIYQQVVVSRQMPMANTTGLTEEDRALIGRWFLAGAKTD